FAGVQIKLQQAQECGTKLQWSISAIATYFRKTELIRSHLVELIIRQKLSHMVSFGADVFAGHNGYTVLMARKHQRNIRVFLHHAFEHNISIMRRHSSSPIRGIAWLVVRMGKHVGIAVWVLLEHAIGPIGFFLRDIKAKADHYEFKALGREQVIVVVVVAFFPRVVRGIACLPAGGLLKSLIALWAKVLVVQVIWSGISTGPVIVITGKHTVDDFCTVKDLLGFRCYFEFLTRIVFIIGFPNPVFNDVAGVRVVGNFALVRVIGHPLCGIKVGLLPHCTFFWRGIFYRTFDNVLGISVVRD